MDGKCMSLSRGLLMGLYIYDITPSDYAWLANRVLGTKSSFSGVRI